MSTGIHVQTLSLTFQAIWRGERPWVALGNFMNEWFEYAHKQRAHPVAVPLPLLPEAHDLHTLRWVAFCVATVEWLCTHYGVPLPSWVQNDAYCLPEPWFDSPSAHKLEVRERLRQRLASLFVASWLVVKRNNRKFR